MPQNATPNQTENGTGPTSSEARANEHRSRLLQALASVAASKGFALTTIADIVREAGVSKRTFYEHFASKEACFLALYRAASRSALRSLNAAVALSRPGQSPLVLALQAFFEHLAQGPGLVRVLFVDIHQLGAEGLRVRRELMQALADFLVYTLNADASTRVSAPPRTHTTAMALAAVGGINELVLQALEQGRGAQLGQLAPCASDMVRGLVGAERAGF